MYQYIIHLYELFLKIKANIANHWGLLFRRVLAILSSIVLIR